MPGWECLACQGWSEEIALQKESWENRKAVYEDCTLSSRLQLIALLPCLRPGLFVIQ